MNARFPRPEADEIPGSYGAFEAQILRQIRLAPRAVFRHRTERAPRRIIQHRFVNAVETVFDAQRQRTRQLPAALFAEKLLGLLVSLFHYNNSLVKLVVRSNRLGMSPLIRRAERVVKTHRDVADEQTSSIGDFEAAGLALHEAVGFKQRERCEFRREMLLEIVRS